jgi:hypothetical protein
MTMEIKESSCADEVQFRNPNPGQQGDHIQIEGMDDPHIPVILFSGSEPGPYDEHSSINNAAGFTGLQTDMSCHGPANFKFATATLGADYCSVLPGPVQCKNIDDVASGQGESAQYRMLLYTGQQGVSYSFPVLSSQSGSVPFTSTGPAFVPGYIQSPPSQYAVSNASSPVMTETFKFKGRHGENSATNPRPGGSRRGHSGGNVQDVQTLGDRTKAGQQVVRVNGSEFSNQINRRHSSRRGPSGGKREMSGAPASPQEGADIRSKPLMPTETALMPGLNAGFFRSQDGIEDSKNQGPRVESGPGWQSQPSDGIRRRRRRHGSHRGHPGSIEHRSTPQETVTNAPASKRNIFPRQAGSSSKQ